MERIGSVEHETTPGDRAGVEPRSKERAFTREHALSVLTERNNWGRWGEDDQRGATNLIGPEERLAALKLVRRGEVLSLCRKFPTTPGPGNPRPAQLHLKTKVRREGGAATDFVGVEYHGLSCTHIDALCHVWDRGSFWNGRGVDDVLSSTGSTWGDIDQWGDGLLMRGVLFDVPSARGAEYVTSEEPVQGWELEEIARRRGIEVRPGDALVVHCGRDAWDRAQGRPWGSGAFAARGEFGKEDRPGLHASCLEYMRDVDASTLVWDMLEAIPNGLDLDWSVHAAIPAFGMALVDNALTEPLADVCGRLDIHEFALVLAPLRIAGGTGSPINPLVMF